MKAAFLTAIATATLLGACTTTGNVERNAAAGAAVGALAGAIIGNNTGNGDAGKGALAGAAIGGVGGGVVGYSKDQRLEECRAAPNTPREYDRNSNRYFYYVPGTNRTCWSDGQPR